MDREGFLKKLHTQYIEEIHEVYVECAHGERVDFSALRSRLTKLMKNAMVSGLQQKDFVELINRTLTAEVIKTLGFDKVETKAA